MREVKTEDPSGKGKAATSASVSCGQLVPQFEQQANVSTEGMARSVSRCELDSGWYIIKRIGQIVHLQPTLKPISNNVDPEGQTSG